MLEEIKVFLEADPVPVFDSLLSDLKTAERYIRALLDLVEEQQEELKEIRHLAYISAQHHLDGVVKYDPAKRIMRLLRRCEECGNKLKDDKCPICSLFAEEK